MKKKSRKKHTNSTRGPFFAAHPFNGTSIQTRIQISAEHGKRQREIFEAVLPEIVDLISRIDPLHTIALMSAYGLMGTPDQNGNHKRTTDTRQVLQGHIEFLQALSLKNRLSARKEFPEPDLIQRLFDLLPELFGAYQDMRAGTPIAPSEDEISPGQGAGVIQVQEFLRAHTSIVRNWGYFGNVTRISRQLLSKLDDDYERLAGMKLSKIVDVFEGLVRRKEKKINQHWEMVHSAFSQPTKDAMLKKFFAEFKLKGYVDEFRTRLASPELTFEQVKWALLHLSDRFIAPALIITNQEISEEFEIDLEAVSILTNRISLAFADLSDEDPESFFLENPVWLRPLIYLQKDNYFCSLPQTLLSFIFPIADELLAPFNGLQTKLSTAKAKFLEDEVSRLFDVALAGCSQHRGFKWKEGAQQFESDLVIRFDTTLILVEAKSGRVSWPALRGAPSRMIEHIKKLIVEPSDQSGRLAERLEEDIACIKRGENPILDFPLPLAGVTCVVRLSVMLHDFATIQSVPTMLADAGVLKNKYPLAPCMSLADLEVMLDLLETPYLRLHYLRRRAELLMSLQTIGDELDMLGIYLDTAMNLGLEQGSKQKIITFGYSAKIDRYYSLRDESRPCKKPQPNISQWFKRLCKQLELRARPGWSEIACALLSIGPVDQVKFERHVRILAAKIKAGKAIKDAQDTMVLIPPEWDCQAVAFQIKRGDDPPPYSLHSKNIAQQAFDSRHVNRCVVLVVDATDINLSYLSVAMFTAGETNNAIFY